MRDGVVLLAALLTAMLVVGCVTDVSTKTQANEEATATMEEEKRGSYENG